MAKLATSSIGIKHSHLLLSQAKPAMQISATSGLYYFNSNCCYPDGVNMLIIININVVILRILPIIPILVIIIITNNENYHNHNQKW